MMDCTQVKTLIKEQYETLQKRKEELNNELSEIDSMIDGLRKAIKEPLPESNSNIVRNAINKFGDVPFTSADLIQKIDRKITKTVVYNTLACLINKGRLTRLTNPHSKKTALYKNVSSEKEV